MLQISARMTSASRPIHPCWPTASRSKRLSISLRSVRSRTRFHAISPTVPPVSCRLSLFRRHPSGMMVLDAHKSLTGPNFTVSPGFEQVYSLGTCAVGLINFNPAGGPDVAFCHYLMVCIFLCYVSIYMVTVFIRLGPFCHYLRAASRTWVSPGAFVSPTPIT